MPTYNRPIPHRVFPLVLALAAPLPCAALIAGCSDDATTSTSSGAGPAQHPMVGGADKTLRHELRGTHTHAVTVRSRRSTFIARIGTRLRKTTRAIGSGIEHRSTRFAELVANGVAAEAVDAEATQTLIGHRARNAVQTFANSSTIALVPVVAWRRARRIYRIVRNVDARPCLTG